ncbi:DUF4186 domain-containing protein [Salinisphaera sp. T31B1]|uniref:DUF4186 domain-containing protein n=1 Tax=Salinisphaera sp. T31B1 TaxID=727963 RepID=UPI00333E70B2
MRDRDALFAALARSDFRRRFALSARDAGYLQARGLDEVMAHAERFIDERLAPAAPVNDGRQTPMRGHPVFVAQHATAACCRSCLARWHEIPVGRALTVEERAHVLASLRRWLGDAPRRRPGRSTRQHELF